MADYPFALDASVFRFPLRDDRGADREDDASIWFGRGLAWAHGFNMEEAARCFSLALDAAPEGLPLAHWGLALCHGPYYTRHGARYIKEGIKPVGNEELRCLSETDRAFICLLTLRN